MSTQVWFYLLADATDTTRTQFILKLCDTAWRRGRALDIQCASQQEASQLDDALWVWTPESFIPHSLEADNCPASIRFFHQRNADGSDILLNLTQDIPMPGKYQRLVEIINPDSREASRSRWRAYQQMGLSPELKPIGG